MPVDQVHPEYSPGQLEVSVGVAGPVAAADRVVLVRDVIRTVARELGLRVSLSAKPSPDVLGNGAHLHVSLWRDGANLFGTGDDGYGMAPEARSFLAGMLAELPALFGVVCASPVSFLRLGPSRWTGVYGCWGVENREAPLRLIQGHRASRPGAANVELKAVDASGNPYLAVGAVIAAGLHGIDAGLELPDEVTIDPATMDDAARAAAGVAPLPAELGAAAARRPGLRRAPRGDGRDAPRHARRRPRQGGRRRRRRNAARALRALPVPLLRTLAELTGDGQAAIRRAHEAVVAPLLPDAYRLWDVHAHLGADADGTAQTWQELVARMDAHGIEHTNVFTFARDDLAGFRAANDEVLAAARASDGRLVPYARAHPEPGDDAGAATRARGGRAGHQAAPAARPVRVRRPRRRARRPGGA